MVKKEKMKEYRLEISADVEVNGEIYFLAFNAPALLKKNKTGEIKIVFPFGLNIKNLYTEIVAYQNKILLVPCHAREFILYDVHTKKIIKKEIPNLEKQENKDNFFDGAVLYKKYAIIIGCWYAGILVIDMETFDIKIIDGWFKEYQLKRVLGYKAFFATDVCIVKNSIFILMSNAGYIMEYNLVKEKANFHLLGDKNISWINICYDGNCFWLRRNDHVLISWNNKTGECMRYDYVEIEKKDKQVGYIRSWYQDKTIYFSDRCRSSILKVNLDEHKKCDVLSIDRSEIISREVICKLCLYPLDNGDVIYENLNFCVNLEDYIEYIKQIN